MGEGAGSHCLMQRLVFRSDTCFDDDVRSRLLFPPEHILRDWLLLFRFAAQYHLRCTGAMQGNLPYIQDKEYTIHRRRCGVKIQIIFLDFLGEEYACTKMRTLIFKNL